MPVAVAFQLPAVESWFLTVRVQVQLVWQFALRTDGMLRSFSATVPPLGLASTKRW